MLNDTELQQRIEVAEENDWNISLPARFSYDF